MRWTQYLKSLNLLFSTGLFLILSCSPKTSQHFAKQEDVQLVPRSVDQPRTSGCYEPLSYVAFPELIRMKYVRVNFHFINSADGRYMMPESDATQYAKDWLAATNGNLEHNMKMFLPVGNNTPALPIPYRYVLSPDPDKPGDDGVYYHVDDTLSFAVKTGRDRNISDTRLIKKYAVDENDVLNIFIQTHQLDSIKSRTYKPDGSGISLGTSVKIFGQWFKKPSVWDYRGIFNHEIGHTLGLAHTWSGFDGCDDTPGHPNCWNKTDVPPCDSLYSNNMMDYNAHEAALTPCQLGKILMNMTREGSMQRNLLVPTWCALDTTSTITIIDSVRWSGSMDIENNILIKTGGKLEIGCRISMPEKSSITIQPGGTLILLTNGRLHNACGDQWEGIVIEQLKKEAGRIIVTEGGKIENTVTAFDIKS